MRYLTTVRYGAMGYVGSFSTEVVGLKLSDDVVARTDRGVEFGRVISPCEVLPEDDQKAPGLQGDILRRMTPADHEKLQSIEGVDQPQELKFCQKRVQERGLPMKLACVEHLFGGTKIIFYFLADGRVDFRELVKDLAQEYHCRIELRQIGVRDEARLLADYEHCGQPICCRTFMKKLEPVTMKMAKSQKATLDPAKISGRCGRLMCCLRFEDAVYEESKKRLPPKGSRVVTPKGNGTVIDYSILCQLVRFQTQQGQQVVVGVEEIESVEQTKSAGRGTGKGRRRNTRNRGQGGEPGGDDESSGQPPPAED